MRKISTAAVKATKTFRDSVLPQLEMEKTFLR
jgi:hypothetical protein